MTRAVVVAAALYYGVRHGIHDAARTLFGCTCWRDR